MMGPPFIAVNARDVLSRYGLTDFNTLWSLQLDVVAAPNTAGAGWSSVHRLELGDANGELQSFYLKRQEGYLARSFRQPLGELTYLREFRAIQDYAHRGIPALETAFFAQRLHEGKRQAILITRALDAYRPLDLWFEQWPKLSWRGRQDLILATAALVRALHNTGRIHNRLYPKHVFLKLDGDGAGARLIDLETTRFAWLGERDYIRDLERLHLSSQVPSRSRRLRFLLAYLGRTRLDDATRNLFRRLGRRQPAKAGRE